MQLEQLVYISTPRYVLPKAELRNIVIISRRNNNFDGLTGLLLAGHKRFLQVLEGRPGALSKAFDRIRYDSHHFAVVVLWRIPVTKRSFPDWLMGFEHDDTITGDQTLIEFLDHHADAIKDRNLLADLQGFARLTSKAA